MSNVRHWFANPLALALLAVLPVLALMAWRALRRRRQVLIQLGNSPVWTFPGQRRREQVWLRAFCLTSGLTLLILGTAGPQWGRDWNQAAAPGRDIVVVLDLSRSMLAQDVLPSRQDRAKKALEELSYKIEQRGGHRLALVAFAARGRVVCPLTHDYDHFRMALADLDAANPHPDLRPLSEQSPSGTRIGAGLRAAVELLDGNQPGYQDILLLSDGDDPARDDEWREGAEEARKRGIAVHTVGIGNPEIDTSIPLRPNVALKHNNEVVRTRLQEQPLEAIARWTHGTYTPARTQALPLGDLFEERIERQAVRESGEDLLPAYQERYPWFLGPALAFLAAEMAIGRRRGRRLVK